ncbi:MAG: CocE/NonD family hydrolase [Pseudomonadota bacterium]
MGLCWIAPARAQEPPLDARLNETVIMIPSGAQGAGSMETTVFRPPGAGPFPLLIINHGKSPGNPQSQPRERFIYMAAAFVRRGYAVMVPMRTGFAHSSGHYADFGCDMRANGEAQANDVADAVRYARRQSWIDPTRIVVAGQSYGGLASVALAARDVPGVRGVLNFAGGLKIDGGDCDWRAALVQAFAHFGARNRIPSLWLYGANDSYFGPDLVARMFGAYSRSGGAGRLVAYGAFKRDAHVMLASRDGEKVWRGETEQFLQSIDMPVRELYAVAEPAPPPKTNFASVDNIDAVPYLPDSGRAAYRSFLERMTPRAFALSPSGAWGWAEEGEQPDSRALAACQSNSRQPCRLYSVDQDVVWQEPAGEAAAATGRTE